MPRSLVLASASPARLRLLEAAGLRPTVQISGFDEDSLQISDPSLLVEQLAIGKASAVADQRRTASGSELVLGCDSLLAFDGQVYGKAATADEVIARWRRFRGGTGELLTGHCLIDIAPSRELGQVSAVARSLIRFGNPSDSEIETYASTAEALSVAGPFTIDGVAAAFIDSIDGNPGNVIGVSLPLVRELMSRLGVDLVDLWAPA